MNHETQPSRKGEYVPFGRNPAKSELLVVGIYSRYILLVALGFLAFGLLSHGCEFLFFGDPKNATQEWIGVLLYFLGISGVIAGGAFGLFGAALYIWWRQFIVRGESNR